MKLLLYEQQNSRVWSNEVLTLGKVISAGGLECNHSSGFKFLLDYTTDYGCGFVAIFKNSDLSTFDVYKKRNPQNYASLWCNMFSLTWIT